MTCITHLGLHSQTIRLDGAHDLEMRENGTITLCGVPFQKSLKRLSACSPPHHNAGIPARFSM